MTPIETILRCGFRHTGRRDEASVQFVLKPDGMSDEVRRTDLRLTVSGIGGPDASYRAEVAMKDRRLVFETSDIRDVAALAIDYRNWLEPPHVVARDPARSMPIPGGLVAMPFHSGDGSWVVDRGADGVERIRNPAARWGACYEDHRARWTGRIVGARMEAQPEAYLRAAGFVGQDGVHRMISWPRQHRPDAVEADRLRPISFDVEVVRRPGRAPLFTVLATDAGGAVPQLHFGSRDVRDVLAFVAAVENVAYDEVGPQVLAGIRALDLPGGANDLRNPFGDPGKETRWLGMPASDGGVVVANPVFSLGHLYVAWRDRWASDVLENRAPQPCSPCAPSPDAAVPAFTPGRVRFAGLRTDVCSSEGGEPQAVAVFEDRDGGPEILMGRAFLEHRYGALVDAGMRPGLEDDALAALHRDAVVGQAPAPACA